MHQCANDHAPQVLIIMLGDRAPPKCLPRPRLNLDGRYKFPRYHTEDMQKCIYKYRKEEGERTITKVQKRQNVARLLDSAYNPSGLRVAMHRMPRSTMLCTRRLAAPRLVEGLLSPEVVDGE